jgi:hypothetical protein
MWGLIVRLLAGSHGRALLRFRLPDGARLGHRGFRAALDLPFRYETSSPGIPVEFLRWHWSGG